MSSVTAAATEQFVLIPDTTLWQGQRASLPVMVRLHLPRQVSLLRLVLLYSAYRLRLLGVRSNTALDFCSTLSFYDTVFAGDTGRVVIECRGPRAEQYSGVIGHLDLEVLAGQDTVAWLRPIEVWGDTSIFLLSGQTAWIRIENGPPVEPVLTDGLGAGIPNPFVYRLSVQYAVVQPAWVFFRLFSFSGEEVPLEPSRVYVPRAGAFPVSFSFRPWELASGGYVLRMETDYGTVYFLPILCVK
ncbi:MAG: hypothetical protein NZ473_06280 [Candidatus Kapabacteria bacterium]|nr:hypothetical protein [Candidatus Kapabacteria bacterium]MCS7169741.1 hypothetical protein [Candidatus Kapabacteria bacterium]MDW7997735.1 hypothetical protein [Bacteroidota bacterium]MDW8225620.1 hypothetical protein [Bacteroidota bacterium]